MKRFRTAVGVLIVTGAAVGLAIWRLTPVSLDPIVSKGRALLNPENHRYTVSDRLDQIGDSARARFASDFQSAGVSYPPNEVILVGLKKENILEVYARGESGPPAYIRSYPILGASGVLGPKIRQGDRQVPEGVYGIEYLNPNSRYHLSMKIDYPNEFDRMKAVEEGRSKLGGDIMIHGKTASIGCLAMGDEAVEELFTMVAETGRERVKVILSPVDFRELEFENEFPIPEGSPDWTPELYTIIQNALNGVSKLLD